MTSVLIALIAAVGVALTIGSARRALAERDAVERHHRTLDALGTLAQRAESAPLAGAPPGGYQPRHRRARRSLVAPRPGVAGVAGVGFVVVAIAIWFLAVGNHGATAPKQAANTTASTATTKPALRGAVATTTTPVAPLVLLSSDNQQASYRVNRPSLDLELVPTAACWVEIKTSLGGGPTVFVGILRPGTRQPVPTGPTTGGVSIRLGNPGGMSVMADGATVAVPVLTGSQPVTLLFQPPS